jgi:hypothetical protein
MEAEWKQNGSRMEAVVKRIGAKNEEQNEAALSRRMERMERMEQNGELSGME